MEASDPRRHAALSLQWNEGIGEWVAAYEMVCPSAEGHVLACGQTVCERAMTKGWKPELQLAAPPLPAGALHADWPLAGLRSLPLSPQLHRCTAATRHCAAS